MAARTVEEFGRMLKDDTFVFSGAWDALAGTQPLDTITEPIHEKDKAVNQRERAIRKMLVEHLAVNPGSDIPGCLAMMSLVKDAERLGDYVKNLYEVTTLLDKPIDKPRFEELFDASK